MKKFAYKKIDAFTAAGSSGNPAACLYLKEGETLSPETMLKVGREHKGFVSEVVFCTPLERGSGADFELVFYSSECEVDFCGHGTIACMYSLVESDPAWGGRKEIYISTKKGILTVYNELQEQDAVYIMAPEPEHLGTDLDPEKVSEALGISRGEISGEHPIDLIDAGLRTLLVPIGSLEREVSIFPDREGLKDFCMEKGVDIILIFSREVKNPGALIHSRVFAPKFGYLEDPATGSGNSALGYYMLKNGIWKGEPALVEQGPAFGVFNVVKLKTAFCPDGSRKVLFGGRGTSRIIGEYIV